MSKRTSSQQGLPKLTRLPRGELREKTVGIPGQAARMAEEPIKEEGVDKLFPTNERLGFWIYRVQRGLPS